MNLATRYMGFELPHPLVPGAGPFADSLDTVRRLEDAGAPMVVMHSLFEEQVAREEVNVTRSIEPPKESYAEALSYVPEPDDFVLGPDDYLEKIDPERFRRLASAARDHAARRVALYEQLARITLPLPAGTTPAAHGPAEGKEIAR